MFDQTEIHSLYLFETRKKKKLYEKKKDGLILLLLTFH